MIIKVSQPTVVQCFHGPCEESYKKNPVHEQTHIPKLSWQRENSSLLQTYKLSLCHLL